MRLAASLLFVAASVLLPETAHPQPPPTNRPAPPLRPGPVGPARDEIVVYRDRNFDGPAVAVARDEPNLRLAWTVGSVLVRRGTWRLCERPNHQGSCTTLSQSRGDLGRLRIQSARLVSSGPPHMAWRVLGAANLNVLIPDRRTIQLQSHPRLEELRLCAETARINLHTVRARFTNGVSQTLDAPASLDRNACSHPIPLHGRRDQLTSVEVTGSSIGVTRGRIRVEGR